MADRISDFMLERYRYGELCSGDRELVETALSADDGLRFRLEELDASDSELRLLYPAEKCNFSSAASGSRIEDMFVFPYGRGRTYVAAGLAAAAVAALLIPLLYFVFAKDVSQSSRAGIPLASLPSGGPPADGLPGGDRPKGLSSGDSELSIYLKSDTEFQLRDLAVLGEGNTVQLAYTAPAGTERYGVIFSIDGRSVVTAHYPYGRGQSSLLVPGRRTFLDEAYTLDDAPDYEIFVFVVSKEPLDAETVLKKAGSLAGNIRKADIRHVREKSAEIYKGCEVETVTVLKK